MRACIWLQLLPSSLSEPGGCCCLSLVLQLGLGYMVSDYVLVLYMLLFAATGTCLYNGLYHRWLTSLGLMVGAIVFYATYVLSGLTLNLHSLLV